MKYVVITLVLLAGCYDYEESNRLHEERMKEIHKEYFPDTWEEEYAKYRPMPFVPSAPAYTPPPVYIEPAPRRQPHMYHMLPDGAGGYIIQGY